MTLQPILTCPDPTNMVALAAYQIGFVPQETLVLLFMAPNPDNDQAVVDLTARIDLASGVQHLPEICQAHLPPGGHFIAIIFSEHQHQQPFTDLVHTLTTLRSDFVPQVPLITATAQYVVAVDIAPETGQIKEVSPRTALAEVWHSSVAAQCVVAGQQLADSEQNYLERWVLPTTTPTDQSSWAHEFEAATTQTNQIGWLVTTWQQQWSAYRADPAAPVAPTARFAAAMTNSWFRDVVLVAAMYGLEQIDPARIQPDSAQLTELLGAAFASGSTVRPQQQHIEPIRHVMTRLSAVTQGQARTAVLSVLAFIAWWSGDGGQARRVLDQIPKLPTYHLAVLLQRTLAHSVPPGWCTNRR